MSTWVAGSLVTSTASFANAAGTATDPTTITVKVKQPNSAEQSFVYPNSFITKVSVGVYSAEVDTTGQSGEVTIEWIGTGACQAISYTVDTIEPAPL